jgi:hypothetical protein
MASEFPDLASESRHNQTLTQYNLKYKEIPNHEPLCNICNFTQPYQAVLVTYNIEWKTMIQKVNAQEEYEDEMRLQ